MGDFTVLGDRNYQIGNITLHAGIYHNFCSFTILNVDALIQAQLLGIPGPNFGNKNSGLSWWWCNYVSGWA